MLSWLWPAARLPSQRRIDIDQVLDKRMSERVWRCFDFGAPNCWRQQDKEGKQ